MCRIEKIPVSFVGPSLSDNYCLKWCIRIMVISLTGWDSYSTLSISLLLLSFSKEYVFIISFAAGIVICSDFEAGIASTRRYTFNPNFKLYPSKPPISVLWTAGCYGCHLLKPLNQFMHLLHNNMISKVSLIWVLLIKYYTHRNAP